MLHSLEEKVDPRHATLLVIDVQNDFFADRGAFDRIGRDVRTLRSMMPQLHAVIAAARAAGIPVTFVRYGHTEATESQVHLEQRSRGRADEPICREGTWGAEFFEIQPEGDETVVVKHRYSGFIGTDLDLVLRSRNIKTIIMAGVASNGCVEATAREGFMRDYYVVFLSDCTASFSAELHRATLMNVEDAFGIVCTSQDLIGAWSPSVSPGHTVTSGSAS